MLLAGRGRDGGNCLVRSAKILLPFLSFSLTKFRDVDGFVTFCCIYFENLIYFVHVSSSFWNLTSWIFLCLYGLTILAPSFSHESHWMWYRPRACKGLPKRIRNSKRIKMKINRNQVMTMTVDLWSHLMDFIWWISDGFFLSTFGRLCTGKHPYDPFPREGLKKFHEVMCL